MNFKLLHKIAELITLFFKKDAPAIGQAAAAAAIGTAEQDPKVGAVTSASVAFVKAAHELKDAMDAPPQA